MSREKEKEGSAQTSKMRIQAMEHEIPHSNNQERQKESIKDAESHK